jgi:dolichol kinase
MSTPISTDTHSLEQNSEGRITPKVFGSAGLANPSASCAPATQRRTALSRNVLLRKLFHMSPGVLPLILPAIPHPDPLDAASLVIPVTITAILTIAFLAFFPIVRHPGETNLLSKTLSYPAIVLLALLLFPGAAELTSVVVVVLALGDGSAYFGGKLLGGERLPWNSEKTWAGTMTFVFVAAPLASLAYSFEATHWGRDSQNVPLSTSVLCGATAAVAGAVAESLPTQINDNLRVGVAALAAAAAVHFALAA